MASELSKDEHYKVLPLFHNEPLTYFSVIAKAIVEGNTPGRFWVDRVTSPRTLLMWDEGACLGIAGYWADNEVNSSLANIVSREITAGAAEGGHTAFKMYYSGGWAERAGDVFRGMSLQKKERAIYIFNRVLVTPWRDKLPTGCSVERIDASFLERDDLANMGRVKEEIACCWTSMSHFLSKGFGFAMLCEGTISC